MCRILIADDETLERDGIRFLISKFNLELEAFEAENGEEALEFISANPVDILLTDIKMPFMNGIELANAARRLHPRLKIIIFSAYGEFEYARQAINIQVLHYLLKPVNPAEFLEVFSKVIRLCKSERQDEREYRRERMFLNMLQGISGGSGNLLTAIESGFGSSRNGYTLLLIDVRERFYDTNNELFKQAMMTQTAKCTGMHFEYINLNEFQSAVLLAFDELQAAGIACSFAEGLIAKMVAATTAQITIIVGARLDSLAGLHDEYTRLEAMLDYRFFHDRNMVIPADAGMAGSSESSADISAILEKLRAGIEAGDLQQTELNFDTFFNLLKGQGALSTVYIKYTCADLVKEMAEKMDGHNSIDLKMHIEKVFSSSTLLKLRQNVAAVLQALRSGKGAGRDEANKKVIGDVIELVEKNYMKNISLDWVARSVYLSPSYLSYLFKRETGLSLIKYITSYRMEKARELLLNTNMKINDIGEAVGYPNNSYFGMAFRNHFGESPINYRESKGR